MKEERIIRALNEVEDRYILEAAPGRNKVRRISWKKSACAVACLVCFLAFSTAAYATNWYGIRNLLIQASKDKSNLISLSGYLGSPEAEALREWNEFLETYDTDHKILNELGNRVFVAEGRTDWSMYGVYSYEMGEKLDEIVKKYGLKLHNEMNIIGRDELMYRVGGSFIDSVKGGAYIYEDGTFLFESDVKLKKYGIIDFQLIRKVKGTFEESFLNIGQFEDYEEWQYVTRSGEPVLLAIGLEHTSLIFVESEDCFISVNVLAGMEDDFTKEDLQELADQIDFSILEEVKIPDMRGDIQ